MVTAQVFTDRTELATKQFDDMARAERYAMNVLGLFTSNGTICRVVVNDTMTGESNEFEF